MILNPTWFWILLQFTLTTHFQQLKNQSAFPIFLGHPVYTKCNIQYDNMYNYIQYSTSNPRVGIRIYIHTFVQKKNIKTDFKFDCTYLCIFIHMYEKFTMLVGCFKMYEVQIYIKITSDYSYKMWAVLRSRRNKSKPYW